MAEAICEGLEEITIPYNLDVTGGTHYLTYFLNTH
jgi:hypothetical protein